MLFNCDSAISRCFCLHWHLDSELCIRNSWAGHKRRVMGGRDSDIHHECLPLCRVPDISRYLAFFNSNNFQGKSWRYSFNRWRISSISESPTSPKWRGLTAKRGLVTSMSASALSVHRTASRGALLSSGMNTRETLPWLSVLRRYEGLYIPSLSLRDFFHPIQKMSSE